MSKLNVVFLCMFPYPQGMAGSKDMQRAIDGMKDDPDISIHVVVTRQSSRMNPLSGNYHGTPYETLMGDQFQLKALLTALLLHLRARRAMQRLFQPDRKNVLFIFGPPMLENVPTIRYARRLGYKTAFDIVEDNDFAFQLSKSLWHRVNNLYTRRATRNIAALADGLVVISNHLENKLRKQTGGMLPIHHRHIIIQFERFPEGSPRFGDPTALFYAGSFNSKDGIPFLLDAFDQLARDRSNLRLVLTGKGTSEDMEKVMARINDSPYRERIEYKGYLDDPAFYATLNSVDIPCMTRINSGYANAGFPYKLGEYLATGKPVIASRISDVESMLEDRREAMLVKPEDSGEIVKAVTHLLDHPEEARAIGRQGREKAKTLFDYRMQGKLLATFFKNIAMEKASDMEHASMHGTVM